MTAFLHLYISTWKPPLACTLYPFVTDQSAYVYMEPLVQPTRLPRTSRHFCAPRSHENRLLLSYGLQVAIDSVFKAVAESFTFCGESSGLFRDFSNSTPAFLTAMASFSSTLIFNVLRTIPGTSRASLTFSSALVCIRTLRFKDAIIFLRRLLLI